MSIEKVIAANTAAVEKLTALLEAGAVAAPAQEEKPKATKKTKAEPKEEAVEEEKPKATKKPTAKKDKKAEAKPAGVPDEVKDMIKRVAKDIGRDAAVKLLGDFDAEKADQLDADRYDEFVAAGEALFADDDDVELDDDDLDELVA